MDNDPHYVRKIVALGETRRVVTHQPILTDHGIKLVDSGVQISAALYDKLVLHKLLPPIDECLTVEDAVTVDSLVDGVTRLLATESSGGWLREDQKKQVLGVFAGFPLNPVLSFKLTVAREEAPRIYSHSLEVALCALVLALNRPGAAEGDLVNAVAAGLFHDLGLLHVHSSLLQADERPLDDRERQGVYSHPILTHLILMRFPEWCPAVSRAVLEHHERLDSSGYPRGLAGHEISPLGQLLAVAELAASLISRRQGIPVPAYVHVILRLNQGKVNLDLANAMMTQLLQGRSGQGTDEVAPTPYGEILSSLVRLSEGIQNWQLIVPGFGELPVVVLINRRISRLERNLAGVGVDLKNWGMIDPDISEDAAALREIEVAAMEGAWQLRAIAQEIHRKWEQLRPVNPRVQEAIWDWLKRIEGRV
jgi:HD-GYP domain-containing protein (c-di-GMP phosphodiesterase class II)